MKIEITLKQATQFNQMLATLKRIKAYQSPAKLRKDSEKDWGLNFEEAIEMSYENIQGESERSCKGVSPINHSSLINHANKFPKP